MENLRGEESDGGESFYELMLEETPEIEESTVEFQGWGEFEQFLTTMENAVVPAVRRCEARLYPERAPGTPNPE